MTQKRTKVISPKDSFLKIYGFNKLVLVVNFIAVLALMLSYFSATAWIKTFFWLVYFGVAGTVFLLINVAFIAYWLLRRKVWFILSLLMLIFGYNFNTTLFQFTGKSIEHNPKKLNLKVMTLNVALFSLKSGKLISYNKDNIMKLIQKEDPDIICMQEFQCSPRGYGDINDRILGLGFKDGYFQRNIEHMYNLHSGIAIFSKYPIVNKGFYEFSETPSVNGCIFTDLKIDSLHTIRVFSTHFQSVRINPPDYKYLKDAQAPNTKKAKGIKEIMGKIRRGITKRINQADLIEKVVVASPYPVVLCGDFNDPPTSYIYRKMTSVLKDTYVENGKGFGATYAGPLPFLRIDNILVSKDVAIYDYRIIIGEYSDHYPVVSNLGF